MKNITIYLATLLCLLTLCSVRVFSQEEPSVDILYRDGNNGIPKYINEKGGHKPAVEDNGISWLKSALGFNENDGWNLLNTETDKLGYIHYRLRQTYSGYPVSGTMYIVHTKGGVILSANGEYAPDLDVNTNISVSEQMARLKAINHINADLYKWQIPSEEARLKREQQDPAATHYPKSDLVIAKSKEGDYRLCHRFDIYAQQPMGRYYVFIDVNTGEVINKTSRIFHADVPGTGQSQYSGIVSFTCDSFASGFRLRETGRGNGIETYDCQNSTTYATAIDFVHPDTLWDSLPPNDTLAIDVHYGAEATYDYLFNIHGRNSIDGNGFKLLNYVHYDNNFTNAFWDGQRMTYGDGDASIGPLVSPDICGHEIGHGLQQFTAGFTQNGEAASLAESFSDIQGAMVEAYLFPGRTNAEIYNTGDQPVNDPNGLRNFIDPSLTSHPDTYGGTNWDASGLDVHGNGVLQDHWFYILSEGKSGTNDNGDAFVVSGIGRDKAAEIVFRSLIYYLTPNSNFEDARYYAILAAVDIFGACSVEEQETTNAWYAVGVGDEYSSLLEAEFSFETDVCKDPVEVSFKNMSTAAVSFQWDFGDGNFSTMRQPVHAYASDGTYTVKLVATGCDKVSKDSMILIDEVEIDNSIGCDSISMPVSGDATTTSCYGWVYDSGGKDGDAEMNTDGTYTISPSGASKVSIKFTEFNYILLGTVTLYDGPDKNSPVLATYNSINTPTLNDEITSSGPNLTINEDVSGFPVPPGFPLGSGFSAFWECEQISITGVNEFNGKEFMLYPNPAKGEVFIRSAIPGAQVKIYSSIGRLIYVGYFSDNETNIQTMSIDLNDCSPGAYYVEIINEQSFYKEKLILVK